MENKCILNLTGKKILITGASSGIGQATAQMVSQLGGKVVLTGRDRTRLNHTLSILDGTGHYAIPYDFLDFDGTKTYVEECIRYDAQRFDGLVFSIGIAGGTVTRMENFENLQRIMATNYYTYFNLLRIFSSKKVLNDCGSVVAVSSAAVEHFDKSQVSYASSKAALEAASAVAAKEFVSRKVRVNTVRPEMTVTPMATHFQNNTTADQRDRLYPLGMLTAEDVANMIVFLLSDMSLKLTGQNIYLSAGNDGRPINYIV